MNKKEISEIRKNFTDDSGFFTVGKVLSAFIDAEKNIAYKNVSLYSLLPQDEAELIMIDLKKTLSGTLGKNLREYAFPDEQYENDGAQQFMYRLVRSQLADEELCGEFLKRIAEKNDYPSTYAVFAAYCTYSVLKKKRRGEQSPKLMTEDAEDSYDYSFVITAICPVDLRIDGLIVSDESGKIEKKAVSDRIIGLPMDGFLFPVFSNREPDVNSVLCYTKNFKKPNVSIVEQLLGCEFFMTAGSEKETFHRILGSVVGEELDYELVTAVNEKLCEYVDSYSNETEPATVNADKLSAVLWETGVSQEKLDSLPQAFEEAAKSKPLTASNIIERKTVVEAEGITVNIGKDSADKVSTQTIDGKKCLVIALDDDVSVNGLPL